MVSWIFLVRCFPSGLPKTPSTTTLAASVSHHPLQHIRLGIRIRQFEVCKPWTDKGVCRLLERHPKPSTTNMVIFVLGKYGNRLGHMGKYWGNGNQSCLTTIPRKIGLIAGIATLAILCHTGCSSPRSHGQLWVCACKIVQMACEQDSLAQPHIMISFPVLRKHTDTLGIQNIPANHFLSLHTTRHTHPSNSRINATLLGKSTMLKPAKLAMFWLQYPLVI